MSATRSSVRGRCGWRASWTRRHADSIASAGSAAIAQHGSRISLIAPPRARRRGRAAGRFVRGRRLLDLDPDRLADGRAEALGHAGEHPDRPPAACSPRLPAILGGRHREQPQQARRVVRSSARGTMSSTKPCSSSDSALWKPSGRSSPTVPLATRAPAKPIRAFGSARITSPSDAKLARTPPVVGSVRTLMNGMPAASSLGQRSGRLGELQQRQGALLHARPAGGADHDGRDPLGSAASKQRASFSPTTLPMLPPMK